MAMRKGMLDTPLLQLTATDYLTVRNATEHILALGTTGSGKSSSTAKHVITAFLKAGMGGIICCAKPTDAEEMRALCAATGRLGSLIDWTGKNGSFNFLAWELARLGADGINSVVEWLMAVLEMARNASPSPGKQGDAFWDDAIRQVLRNSIPVLFAATGTVRIADVLAFVRSTPATPEQMKDAQWQAESFFCRVFLQAAERLQTGPIPGFDDAAGERATDYWRHDFGRLDPKTAGAIRISLTTALDRFNHGWLKDAFCGGTDIVPELTFHGAIILLNMPVLTLAEDGAIAQKLFKLAWQRAALARTGDPAQSERPIFQVADECQHFLHHDAEFLATCRSAKVCTLFLTQSLPTLYAKIGENAHDRAHHLVSNFNTVVLHSSACPETNDWMARKIGRSLQNRASYNESEGSSDQFGMNMGEGTNWGSSHGSGGSSGYSSGQGGGSTNGGSSWNSGSSQGGNDQWGRNRGGGSNHGQSWGHSQTMDHTIEPGQFARMLKTGGPVNGNRVSAVWYQAGRVFDASGGNTLLVEFAQ